MSVESSAPRSRRAVLAAALGGLGALVASRLTTPEAVTAADGDAVTVGSARTGSTETSITTTGSANAIAGISDTGTGLHGSSTSVTPVPGDPTPAGNATGVIGTSGALANIAGNTGETGVYGFSNTTPATNGIWGDSVIGTGVYGTGDTGVYGSGYWGVYGTGPIGIMGDGYATDTGVYGFSGDSAAPDALAGVAVQATAGINAAIALNARTIGPTTPAQIAVNAAAATGHIALNVTGKTKFSRSGRVAVSAGASSKKVTMSGVTTTSYVIATLQSKRTGVYVASVVPATGYFTIYLNKAVTSSTTVGFLVIN
jgi:hypothetical protein